MADAIELNCEIRKVRKDKALRSQLVRLKYMGKLDLEGLLLFAYSNFIL